jgi:hypothetical protein
MEEVHNRQYRNHGKGVFCAAQIHEPGHSA